MPVLQWLGFLLCAAAVFALLGLAGRHAAG